MARVRGSVQAAHAPGRTSSDFRSAQRALRPARLAVQVAVLALSAAFVVGLISAAITGWVLAIDPATAVAPWTAMPVSGSVLNLVASAGRIALATSVTAGLAMLTSAAFVIRWQLAAVRNLPALGAGPARPGAPAVVAGWLVPGWNLVAPKRAIDRLWRSSDPGLTVPTGPAEIDAVRLPRFVNAWWVLWVGANLVNLTVTVAALTSGTVASMLTAQLASVPVSAALAGAGIYLRLVMSAITRRQEQRRTVLTGARA